MLSSVPKPEVSAFVIYLSAHGKKRGTKALTYKSNNYLSHVEENGFPAVGDVKN